MSLSPDALCGSWFLKKTLRLFVDVSAETGLLWDRTRRASVRGKVREENPGQLSQPVLQPSGLRCGERRRPNDQCGFFLQVLFNDKIPRCMITRGHHRFLRWLVPHQWSKVWVAAMTSSLGFSPGVKIMLVSCCRSSVEAELCRETTAINFHAAL